MTRFPHARPLLIYSCPGVYPIAIESEAFSDQQGSPYSKRRQSRRYASVLTELSSAVTERRTVIIIFFLPRLPRKGSTHLTEDATQTSLNDLIYSRTIKIFSRNHGIEKPSKLFPHAAISKVILKRLTLRET